MKALIIGGTGFLSSAVVVECQAAGYDVTVVTRGNPKRPAPPPGVTALNADRTDAAALGAALRGKSFDLVVDCILFQPADAVAVREILRGNVGRYVFISTDFVYGGERRRFPLTEEAPRQSLNRYGLDKAACEDVFAAAWRDVSFPGVSLRPPHIVGAGSLLGTGSKEGRDPWLLWRIRNGRPLLLLDGGGLLIQPVHKTDIARAALAIAAAPPERVGGRAYNIAGPDCVTTRAYYECIHELLGDAPPLTILPLATDAYLVAWPDRAAFTQNRAYSTARLTGDTGFAPNIPLRTALSEMIAALDAGGLPDGEPPQEDSALYAQIQDAVNATARLLQG